MSSPAPSFTFAEETPKRMDLILRCGCEFIYESAGPSPIFLTLKLRQRPGQFIYAEQLNFDPVHTICGCKVTALIHIAPRSFFASTPTASSR